MLISSTYTVDALTIETLSAASRGE